MAEDDFVRVSAGNAPDPLPSTLRASCCLRQALLLQCDKRRREDRVGGRRGIGERRYERESEEREGEERERDEEKGATLVSRACRDIVCADEQAA